MNTCKELLMAVLVGTIVFWNCFGLAGEMKTGTDTRPAIWRNADARKSAAAERVARMDAMAKLLEKIYGLEVNADSSVGDLVRLNETIRTDLQGTIRGMREGKWVYLDSGVCQVEMTVTWREVVRRVESEIRKKMKNGITVSTEEFIKRNIEKRDKDITVWVAGALEGTEGREVVQALRAA